MTPVLAFTQCWQTIFYMSVLIGALQAFPLGNEKYSGQTGVTTHTVQIGPANKRELRELSILLGTPIGNAQTAKAVIGVPSKTTYKPKCPETIEKVDRAKRSDFIKLCPNLRDQEYNKHANRVASILNGTNQMPQKEYNEQKRALIAAVNDMAKMAGAVPSLEKR